MAEDYDTGYGGTWEWGTSDFQQDTGQVLQTGPKPITADFQSISPMEQIQWNPSTGYGADPWAGVFENMAGAYNIGQQIIAGARDPRAGTSVVTGGAQPEDTSWRDRLYAERAASKAAAAGGYSIGGGAKTTFGPGELPEYAIPEFQAPEALQYAEYAPPEREPERERALRREAMGPGLREMRRRTQEAISSSASIDNPAARGKFLADVLQGMGAGLESVSAGASQQARQQYNIERNEQLMTYNKEWEANAQEAMTAYETELQAAIMDFQQQAQKSAYEYQAALQYPGASTQTQYENMTPLERMRYGGISRTWFTA